LQKIGQIHVSFDAQRVENTNIGAEIGGTQRGGEKGGLY